MSRALFLVARDEALVRSQEAPLTKNALGGQLGTYSSPSIGQRSSRGHESVSAFPASAVRGSALRHRRHKHTHGARSEERAANSAQAARLACADVRSKKEEIESMTKFNCKT